ncbi:MAG: hypothetical protein ACREU6_16655, partial [Steroidobacteraceae bacterium]
GISDPRRYNESIAAGIRHQLNRLGTLKMASRLFPKLKVLSKVPENSRSRPFFGLSVHGPVFVIFAPRFAFAIAVFLR